MSDCYAPEPDRRPPHGLVLAVMGETFIVAALPGLTRPEPDAHTVRRPSRLRQALRRLAASPE
jgi:hypothetical protein